VAGKARRALALEVVLTGRVEDTLAAVQAGAFLLQARVGHLVAQEALEAHEAVAGEGGLRALCARALNTRLAPTRVQIRLAEGACEVRSAETAVVGQAQAFVLAGTRRFCLWKRLWALAVLACVAWQALANVDVPGWVQNAGGIVLARGQVTGVVAFGVGDWWWRDLVEVCLALGACVTGQAQTLVGAKSVDAGALVVASGLCLALVYVWARQKKKRMV